MRGFGISQIRFLVHILTKRSLDKVLLDLFSGERNWRNLKTSSSHDLPKYGQEIRFEINNLLTFWVSTFLEPTAEDVVLELPDELEEDAASSAEELVVLDSDLTKSLKIMYMDQKTIVIYKNGLVHRLKFTNSKPVSR